MRDVVGDGPIQSRAICAGLTARDDFQLGQHKKNLRKETKQTKTVQPCGTERYTFRRLSLEPPHVGCYVEGEGASASEPGDVDSTAIVDRKEFRAVTSGGDFPSV